MSPADFREVVRLLDSTLLLFERPHYADPLALRRELRRLMLQFDLFRMRLGQPAAALQRN